MINFVCKFFAFLFKRTARLSTKSVAQTLAEILIVSGVTGIVFELEIPVLKLEVLRLGSIAQLKRTYGTLSTMYSDIVFTHGSPSEWGLGSAGDAIGLAKINNIMSQYMKIEQNCGTGTGCFPETEYKNLKDKNLDISINQDPNYTKMRLVDGSSIAFTQVDENCNENWGGNQPLQNVCGLITVDLNGDKKPNKYGEDTFGFAFTKYEIVPLGTPMQNQNGFSELCNTLNSPNKSYPNGIACTAWVIYKENFEYNKVYDNCNNNSHAYVNDNNGKNNKNYTNGNDNSWNNGNNNCNYNL